jgi:hypothetical protein
MVGNLFALKTAFLGFRSLQVPPRRSADTRLKAMEISATILIKRTLVRRWDKSKTLDFMTIPMQFGQLESWLHAVIHLSPV